ncbi:hypothetical protein [Roseibium sp. M-1]
MISPDLSAGVANRHCRLACGAQGDRFNLTQGPVPDLPSVIGRVGFGVEGEHGNLDAGPDCRNQDQEAQDSERQQGQDKVPAERPKDEESKSQDQCIDEDSCRHGSEHTAESDQTRLACDHCTLMFRKHGLNPKYIRAFCRMFESEPKHCSTCVFVACSRDIFRHIALQLDEKYLRHGIRRRYFAAI